jgi:hypothetical protein
MTHSADGPGPVTVSKVHESANCDLNTYLNVCRQHFTAAYMTTQVRRW